MLTVQIHIQDECKTEMTICHVEQLYSHHRGWLHNWLRGKLGCSEQAADLVQDTFIRVMAARSNIANLDQPRAYLSSIARNLVIDHWRRKELEQAYLAAISLLPEQEAPSPEQSLLVFEALEQVDKVLQSLPPATRQVFLLSQLDGMTYAAIAEQLDCSVPTIKRHMHKAFLACMQVELL